MPAYTVPRVKRDRLTTRFYVVGGAARACCSTLVCVALLLAVSALRDASDDTTRSATRLFNASRAQRLTVDLETGLRGYLLTGREALLEPARDGRSRASLHACRPARAQRRRARAGGAGAPHRGGRPGLHALHRRRDRGRAGPPARRRWSARPKPARRAWTTSGACMRHYDRRASAASAAMRDDDASGVRDGRRRGSAAIGVPGCCCAAVPLALLLPLARRRRPGARRSASAARRLADGEASGRARREAGAGEVGALARSFNSMAAAPRGLSRDRARGARACASARPTAQLRDGLRGARALQAAGDPRAAPRRCCSCSRGCSCCRSIGALRPRARRSQLDDAPAGRRARAPRPRGRDRRRPACRCSSPPSHAPLRTTSARLHRSSRLVRHVAARSALAASSRRRRWLRRCWRARRSSTRLGHRSRRSASAPASPTSLGGDRRAAPSGHEGDLERRQLLLERLDGREQVAVLGHPLEHVGGGEHELVRVARLRRPPRPPPSAAASRRSAAPCARSE